MIFNRATLISIEAKRSEDRIRFGDPPPVTTHYELTFHVPVEVVKKINIEKVNSNNRWTLKQEDKK